MLSSRSIPLRLVAVAIPAVDRAGVPLESDVTDDVCVEVEQAVSTVQVPPQSSCVYGPAEERVLVLLGARLASSPYLVLQPAWIETPAAAGAPTVEATASYGWRTIAE